MTKKYPVRLLLLICSFLLFIIASCKKDNKNATPTSTGPVVATPTKLGLFEVDTSIFKLLFIPISKVGTQTVDNDLIFDTGSGGMVLDAHGILPASMITTTGFNFTGDSTVVDGITITAQKSTIAYGDDNNTSTKVYGNLAYAAVTIGNSAGNIVIKRLPFFLYYKGVDGKGNAQPDHYFDIMGVSPQNDVTFANGAFVTSPLSYFDPGTGLTKGFKLAALGTSNFSNAGTFVPGVITLGLTAADLSPTSGFAMSQLTSAGQGGFLPYLPGLVTYNTKLTSTTILFDTGTEPYSYIQDKSAPATAALLPANSSVAIALNSGFNFNYTTTPTEYLTYLENPGSSGASISIFGLEFFLTNEYLLNYTSFKLGVKNN